MDLCEPTISEIGSKCMFIATGNDHGLSIWKASGFSIKPENVQRLLLLRAWVAPRDMVGIVGIRLRADLRSRRCCAPPAIASVCGSCGTRWPWRRFPTGGANWFVSHSLLGAGFENEKIMLTFGGCGLCAVLRATSLVVNQICSGLFCPTHCGTHTEKNIHHINRALSGACCILSIRHGCVVCYYIRCPMKIAFWKKASLLVLEEDCRVETPRP